MKSLQVKIRGSSWLAVASDGSVAFEGTKQQLEDFLDQLEHNEPVVQPQNSALQPQPRRVK